MNVAAYRIVKTTRAHAAFTGEAGRRYGGRWNRVGTRMIYTAESRSLAALEVLAHLEGPARGFSLIPCEFPASLIEVIPLRELPADWRSAPPPRALASIGDAWVTRGSSAVLAVPSAIIPQERNYLLNPAHPEFARVTIRPAEAFPFDERLITLPTDRR